MTWGPLLALPVLLPLVLLQGTYFSYYPVSGVIVQVAVVATLAYALWASSAETIVWAFTAGFLIDLLSIAPLGSTSLALILAVLAIAPFRANLAYSRVILPIILTTAAMLIFQLANVVILQLFNIQLGNNTVAVIPTATIVHVLLVVPIYWLLRAFSSMSSQPQEINL